MIAKRSKNVAGGWSEAETPGTGLPLNTHPEGMPETVGPSHFWVAEFAAQRPNRPFRHQILFLHRFPGPKGPGWVTYLRHLGRKPWLNRPKLAFYEMKIPMVLCWAEQSHEGPNTAVEFAFPLRRVHNHRAIFRLFFPRQRARRESDPPFGT